MTDGHRMNGGRFIWILPKEAYSFLVDGWPGPGRDKYVLG